MQTRFLICIVVLSSLLLYSSVYAALDGVSTGIEKIKLTDGEITIRLGVSRRRCIKRANDGEDVICFPDSTMTMRRRGEAYDLSKIIEKWNEFYVYFVKIRKDKYIADLNNDGVGEIAILPMLSGGGAWVLDAFIYTIMDDGLEYYGKGRFFWEMGDHVKFGCPKCWKYDLKSCESCY